VDLDYSQKIGLQFIQMKIDLEKLLNLKVDLVSSKGLSKYIKPIVDREKELIYAR
jgi:predicted nucleotidyltransferase